jgi:tight adherence protein C
VLAFLSIVPCVLFGYSTEMTMLIVPSAFIVGLFVPVLDLTNYAGDRTTEILYRLPYAIDLLVLSMGAGAMFDEAVRTLVAMGRKDHMTTEFKTYLQEVERGLSHEEALQRLASRAAVNRVVVLVQAILQGERLGVPIVSVLKRESTVYRDIRSNAAEERARSASMKLLVGPILMILGCIFLMMSVPFYLSTQSALK